VARESVLDGMTWEAQWRDQVEESALATPSAPTTALPGTAEKVAVMARRHSDGERLHHPDDPVIDWSRGEGGGLEFADFTAGEAYRSGGRGRRYHGKAAARKRSRKVGHW
jgi:hypothetical protein